MDSASSLISISLTSIGQLFVLLLFFSLAIELTERLSAFTDTSERVVASGKAYTGYSNSPR